MTDLIQHRNLDDTMSRTTSQEKFQEIQGVRVTTDRMARSRETQETGGQETQGVQTEGHLQLEEGHLQYSAIQEF